MAPWEMLSCKESWLVVEGGLDVIVILHFA